MMNVGLHCRIVGRPGRAPALARFLAHVKQTQDVWVTTRAEIARHWAEHAPLPAEMRNRADPKIRDSWGTGLAAPADRTDRGQRAGGKTVAMTRRCRMSAENKELSVGCHRAALLDGGRRCSQRRAVLQMSSSTATGADDGEIERHRWGTALFPLSGYSAGYFPSHTARSRPGGRRGHGRHSLEGSGDSTRASSAQFRPRAGRSPWTGSRSRGSPDARSSRCGSLRDQLGLLAQLGVVPELAASEAYAPELRVASSGKAR